jgi:uncharacterized protein (DUF1499 family)
MLSNLAAFGGKIGAVGEGMTDPDSIAIRPRRGIVGGASVLGFWLAAASLAALALAPAGWRLGIWPYIVSFELIRVSAYGGFLAALISLASLGLWARMPRLCRLLAVCGLLLGSVLAYVPWHYAHIAARLPLIHDITTDTANPPVFWSVLPARAAERAVPVEYGGPGVARQQLEAYPDIQPVLSDLPPSQVFELALATAQAMPGWTDIASDKHARRIEASQSSFWMGFTDDVVIRVAPHGDGSRVDMRSLSRQGQGDFGVNAARIRAYLKALKAQLQKSAG